ncbi:hypothetical protein AADG42_09295 [Ammonicoccus fulvus]|uniref:Uncharacterized protein n=1 Tax=Ammonicoccus fulvus TaxID=3138240 RepID=A0ABZ3FQX7_9ACTN
MSTTMADWTLTTAGWGPVRMGSPLPPNLRGQLKPAWECIGPIIQDSSGNDRMEFWTGQPDGSGNITTLHIVDPAVSTRAGIRPGDSLEKVKRTYPSATQFRAATDMTGDVYVLADDATGLFFEIKRGATTVEHISVQRIDSFSAFQVQICGGP